MANLSRNFIKGRMNKSFDERLVPDGEYIDAVNVRINSSRESDVGVVEKDLGNTQLSTLRFNGQPLSLFATCIGAFADGATDTIYWFVHDSNNSQSETGVVDLIVSFNTVTGTFIYHVVSVEVLNFDRQYLITGISKVDDLLFFTDNFNPPRKINVRRYYAPPAALSVDGITEDDISVIVKPPVAAPAVQQLNISGGENFLEDKFVCFAYRYKYKDGEYSALSQFSRPAFQPQPFNISDSRYTNDGMVNFYNAANVTFNTGSEDVIGIDVCFKFSDNPTVNVIDKYIKFDEGWGNGEEQTLTFSNKKIFTILPDSEILRLYDNVPRLAKAQTIMGNRLMYGNYVDGYDLKDTLNRDIRTNYNVYTESEEVGFAQLEGSIAGGQLYALDPFNNVTVSAATANFDLSGIELVNGSVFSFEVRLAHSQYSGADSSGFDVDDQNDPFTVSFDFYLQEDYDSAYNMVYSSAFQAQAGTSSAGGYLPVDQCSDGVTLADRFNCILVPPAGWEKLSSGITNEGQGVRIVSELATPNQFSIQFMGMRYGNIDTPEDDDAYEYFRVIDATMFFQELGDSRSLHSNRDYELGIVYMDDYKRATTALTSEKNTVYIPASASDTKNTLLVNIPSTMTPPSWATSYKFVIKPSGLDYETVYSSIYYPDPDDDSVWIKLDGENQLKVEVGDRLIVKSDAAGPLDSLVKVAVLDKVVKQRDDIITGSLPGVYMRLRPDNFVIESEQSLVLGCNEIEVVRTSSTQSPASLNYPVFTDDGGTYSRWQIGAGDIVTITIWMNRGNRNGCGGNCGALYYSFSSTSIATQDYADVREFIIGQGLNFANAETEVDCLDDSGEMTGQLYEDLYVLSGIPSLPISFESNTVQVAFWEYDDDSALPANERRLYMNVDSNVSVCSGIGGKDVVLSVNVCIQGANNQLVFETEPADALPDVFFESSENFACSPTGHDTNVTNQVVGSVSGVARTDFFNCFTFGNGVESYKASDSITGRSFYLGERVTSTSAQDFKEAHRFADITYSGVYNDETNVNKLNEFNLGLANFAALEDVYGPIQRMASRQTDVLILQEDKISYVLTGKDLLSDAVGGSAVTSVPEVLGKQVARSEEYGISHNPESYAENGPTKFFTDTKRGAVIMLVGDAYSNERLTAVSNLGMREYFRTQFKGQPTQKLGGYDMYNDEYVLSSNNTRIPQEQGEVPCGKTFYGTTTEPIEYTVNMGGATGSVTVQAIGFNVDDTMTLSVAYGGSVFEDTITGDGTAEVTFDADDPTILTYEVNITAGEGNASYELITDCPTGVPLKLVFVTLNNNNIAEQQIHNDMYWSEGSYSSPNYDAQIVFGEAEGEYVVSQYHMVNGQEGVAIFPMDSSQVFMRSVKEPGDDYVFDYGNDKFRWLRTDTLYENNATDIDALLAASSVAEPIDISGAPLDYAASFTMPDSDEGYLYLIYDYRKSARKLLCYSDKSGESGLLEVCCGCETCSSCKPFFSTALLDINANACGAVKATTLYHNGEGDFPTVGDRVYTNQNCANPPSYAVIACGSPSFRLRIGAGGLVTTSEPCTAPTAVSGSIGSTSVANACAQSFTETYYSYGLSIYYDENASEPLAPGFYKLDLPTVVAVEVVDNGLVNSTTNC